MAIGTDDLDFIDEIEDFETKNDTNPQNTQDPEPPQELDEGTNIEDNGSQEEDFISSLLKSKGIEDKSKIKFENEEGSIEEVDWDNLSNEDKLNVLRSSSEDPESDLDESEIQLISAIRNSGMTPAEYLQYVGQDSVNYYIQNKQASEYQYSVDQYSDDDLFKADFISRMGDVTEEEAEEALEKAKSNEALFKKQIGAIRNEYRAIEAENIQQEQIEQEQQAQEQYAQFASLVEDQIRNFTEFQGYNLNLENDDMQMLYDFITGVDAAGNNHFAKALSDPRILVQTAWFALNGRQMIDDITDYFQKEITHVRKDSYEKGIADAKKKMQESNTVVFKDKRNKSQQDIYSDLDDF